jgi:hypothetical protein
LKKLENLDLSLNPCASQKGYREEVFKICTSLTVLDGKDKDGNEVDYTEEDESDEISDVSLRAPTFSIRMKESPARMMMNLTMRT